MKVYRLKFLGASLAAAVLSLSGAALAEQPSQETEATDVDAQAARWLSLGNSAFKAGKFPQAEEAYREAWTIKRGYDIAGDLGMAELAQGKLREGAEHLAFSLRMYPITGDPGVKQQIQKAYDGAVVGLGAIRITAPVKGAQVYADGVSCGEAPFLDPVFVEPGEHVFEARLPGYTGTPQRIVAEKGQALALTLSLEPLPEVQQPSLLPPPSPVPSPPPARRRNIIPAVVLGSVAAAGVGSGLVLFGLSASARSDGQSLRTQVLTAGNTCVAGAATADPRCNDLRGNFQRSDTLHNAAIGTTLVGVSAAAGAAIYLFWPTAKARTNGFGLRAVPTFGVGSGGLTAAGTF